MMNESSAMLVNRDFPWQASSIIPRVQDLLIVFAASRGFQELKAGATPAGLAAGQTISGDDLRFYSFYSPPPRCSAGY